MAAKRIFLLIAHKAFREALVSVLDEEPDLEVVLQAGSLAEALNLDHNIDLALVDPSLPDGDGLVVVRELSRNTANAAVAVVLASSGPDVSVIERAYEAGSARVLSTSSSLQEVVDAIRSSTLE